MLIDRAIIEFDRALRTVFAPARSQRSGVGCNGVLRTWGCGGSADAATNQFLNELIGHLFDRTVYILYYPVSAPTQRTR